MRAAMRENLRLVDVQAVRRGDGDERRRVVDVPGTDLREIQKIFVAQAAGVHLSFGEQLLMMLTLMLTSKGVAGVPRASLVVIAATLAQFNIPEAGLLLLLGVDHFLDMGRSATNVVGNAVASVLVAKWEGPLDAPESPVIEHAPAPSHMPPPPPET